jgi:hypothetical protein
MQDHNSRSAEQAARQRAQGAPANEVPIWLPWSGVLARGRDVAVLLTGAVLYTTSLRFDLTVCGRGEAARDLHMASLGRPDANGDMLCVGVAGAGGFTATNVRRARLSSNSDPAPTLSPNGGFGGHGAALTRYLLQPIPPAGAVTLWVAWSSRGIEETATEFDGSALDELAAQIEVLWPVEDEAPPWSMTPPEPKLPRGGWFAAHGQPS